MKLFTTEEKEREYNRIYRIKVWNPTYQDELHLLTFGSTETNYCTSNSLSTKLPKTDESGTSSQASESLAECCKHQNKSLKRKRPGFSKNPPKDLNSMHYLGRWTKDEHSLFINGLVENGNDWAAIESLVQTRSKKQIRSHAQKLILNLQENLEFVELFDLQEKSISASLLRSISSSSVETRAKLVNFIQLLEFQASPYISQSNIPDYVLDNYLQLKIKNNNHERVCKEKELLKKKNSSNIETNELILKEICEIFHEISEESFDESDNSNFFMIRNIESIISLIPDNDREASDLIVF